MAGFSMTSLEIRMYAPPGQYSGTRADIATVPTVGDVTISFAHEYVHFLQSISSIMGFRLFAELLDLGIKGALVLAGIVNPTGGTVLDKSYRIAPMLKAQPSHAGVNVPEIGDRVQTIADELHVLFGASDPPYNGGKGAWELDTMRISHGSYDDEFVGFVTPRGTFRPINVRLLAEGMARRIDRWLDANHGFAHTWNTYGAAQIAEAEVYNGLRTVLSQPRYQHNVHPDVLDRLTVIVCYLALATPRPDRAVERMLERLAHGVTAGLLAATVGQELAAVLIRENLLSARWYNEVMTGVLHGESSKAMERHEFHDIYEQLSKIQVAANFALSRPDYFANERVTWDVVKGWMTAHSVPHVVASDGPVLAVDGVPCGNNALSLLAEIERVFL